MAYEILVIGSGDTEREVMAKAIIDRHVKLQKCEPVKVRARGLVVLFQEPVNPKVAEILISMEVASFVNAEIYTAVFSLPKEEMLFSVSFLKAKSLYCAIARRINRGFAARSIR